MDMYDSDGKRIISPKDRLSELRAEYIGASSRYSEQHPDLVKMVKEIEALEKETGYTSDVKELQRELTDMEAELAMLAERYSERHPDVKKMQRAVDSTRIELQNALQTGMAKNAVATVIAADNPAYIQLQAQLHAVEAKLSSIAKARKTTKQKIAEFESRLLKSPQVEREYKDLMRDYENASSKYAEIENKQLEAELATALERENKGERFSLIEPPVIPEEPAEPDKTAIIFLGFMLAIGSSIGAVVVRESFNTAIRSPRELAAIMTVPPLIVVPYIETEKEKVEQRSKKRNILSVMLLAGVLVVVVFHLMVMPLDALWFVIMRKLGFFSG